MDSILTSVKKCLGIEQTDETFDAELILFINGVTSVLAQLGLTLGENFIITDASSTWAELFSGRTDLESIKTYYYLKLRLVFDPPQSSFLVEIIKEQIKELEWRINSDVDSPYGS